MDPGGPGGPFQASETFETFGAGAGRAAELDASAEAEELAVEAMVEVMEGINGAEAKREDLEAGMMGEFLRLENMINGKNDETWNVIDGF